MADDRKAVRARVTGSVQGVSFRIWTRDQARALGLSGWVCNEADGSVTALIAGPAPAVSAMVALLRQGPPGAAVAAIAVEDADLADAPAGFTIRS